MKVITNFAIWEQNYREHLQYMYERVYNLFIEYNHIPPSYDYFSSFVYRNTKQNVKYNFMTDTKIIKAIII